MEPMEPMEPSTPLPKNKKIVSGILENGLRYNVTPNHHPKGRLQAYLQVLLPLILPLSCVFQSV